MGCGSSAPDAGLDKEVQKELDNARQEEDVIHKLLLLGAGGSGKSTFFKQLKIIHGDGYSEREKQGYRRQIFGQMIESMQTIIKQCQNLAEAPADAAEAEEEDEAIAELRGELSADEMKKFAINEDFKNASDIVLKARATNILDEEIAKSLKCLWEDCRPIKKMFGHRNKICVPDSTSHFLDNVDRISTSDYMPNDEDVLLVRYRTTGMTESLFKINDASFNVCDVGGQRNERKKWMHFFDGVTAVLFVVALSCYDEVPFEDVTDLDADETTANNMIESVKVFQETIDQPTFANTGFIIFLNKADLMAEKIKRVPITVAFPEYKGPQTFEKSVDHIKNSFLKCNTNKSRDMFTHVTTATDTRNVKRLFDDVQQCVVNWSLKAAGLLVD